MPGLSVIGLQWGDEAKGKLVDWLTEHQDIVVRYQGGANAGHTVVVGEQTYKLHLVPSGVLYPHVLNVVAPGVVLDPATLLREIDGLAERGIAVHDRLMLSDRAHVVFPWHVAEDRQWNERITGEDNIGTTLRGIGPCYQDKVGRQLAIRLGDLLRPDLESRIAEVADFKRRSLAATAVGEPVDFDAAKIFDDYRGYAERLGPLVGDSTAVLLDGVDADRRMLFEGAQGALLDVDHGTYPFVTSSNSSGVGISAGAGVPPTFIREVLGVIKAYSTRVGGGPFPSELHDAAGERIRERGREYGTTTGRPRRCGWFDAVAVRYAARLSGATSLAVTMLDVLSGFDTVYVCDSYTIDGQRREGFPSQRHELERARPNYRALHGWNADLRECRAVDQLPSEARRYLDVLAELVGVPIEVVSVGPERRQTIVCRQGQLVG